MSNTKKEQFNVVKEEKDDKLTIDERVAIKELEDKIANMKKDKEAKCKAAKDQLVEMLEVTVDKYRTATGTAEALRLYRFAIGEDLVDINVANSLASDMALEANKMKEKAKSLSYAKMDELCDGFYDKEFSGSTSYELAFEMMRIDLCRNVGGAAEDMVSFIKRTQEEIDATGEKLKKLKAGKKD